MSETARAMLELVERGWASLTPEEQAIFNDWMLHAHGVDLYLLLRHARRQWSRGQSSISQTLSAIQETAAPASVPPPPKEEP